VNKDRTGEQGQDRWTRTGQVDKDRTGGQGQDRYCRPLLIRVSFEDEYFGIIYFGTHLVVKMAVKISNCQFEKVRIARKKFY
jgi:hypothetical protein